MAQSGKSSAGNAASTAKSAVKAASKAASGNYIGAAAEVVKSEGLRRAIAASLLIHIFLIVCILFIFPMSMYETLQTIVTAASEKAEQVASEIKEFNNSLQEKFYEFYDELEVGDANEEFLVELYSGQGPKITDYIGGTAKWIDKVGTNFISSIKSIFKSATDAPESEAGITDEGMNIIEEQSALWPSLKSQIEHTQLKYNIRIKAIVEAIEENGQNTLKNKYEAAAKTYPKKEKSGKETISSIGVEVYEHYNKHEGASFNDSEVIYELSDIKALYFCVLYSVMYDSDFGEIRLSDYLKWLGWGSNTAYGDGTLAQLREKLTTFFASKDILELPLFDSKVDVTGWNGTYMPQYLTDEAIRCAAKVAEEKKAEMEEAGKKQLTVQHAYEKTYRQMLAKFQGEYGCSAIDYFTYAYVSNEVSIEVEDGQDEDNWNLIADESNYWEWYYGNGYNYGYDSQTGKLLSDDSGIAWVYKYKTSDNVFQQYLNLLEAEGFTLDPNDEHHRSSNQGERGHVIYKESFTSRTIEYIYKYSEYVGYGKNRRLVWRERSAYYTTYEPYVSELKVYAYYKVITGKAYIYIGPRSNMSFSDMTGLVTGDYSDIYDSYHSSGGGG